MSLRTFFNRLLRKAQWMRCLGISGQKISRRQLRRMTVRFAEDGCAAMAENVRMILNTNDSSIRSHCLRQVKALTDCLTALLPFAASEQAVMIQAALQRGQEASHVPPISAPETGRRGITFYTVYIPTLDGRFYYLSDTAYPAGEIVRVPFGYEDKEIFGIVETSQCFPYDKTPLPMWKMKYILEKAPEPIAEEYRRQRAIRDNELASSRLRDLSCRAETPGGEK